MFRKKSGGGIFLSNSHIFFTFQLIVLTLLTGARILWPATATSGVSYFTLDVKTISQVHYLLTNQSVYVAHNPVIVDKVTMVSCVRATSNLSKYFKVEACCDKYFAPLGARIHLY